MPRLRKPVALPLKRQYAYKPNIAARPFKQQHRFGGYNIKAHCHAAVKGNAGVLRERKNYIDKLILKTFEFAHFFV